MGYASIYTDAKPLAQELFTMEKITAIDTIGSDITGKCIFKPHPWFTISLHPFLLKLLHLDNTTTAHTGSAIVTLPSATREYFYLYTNIIESHTYSGAVNILRIINNNTSLPNDKIMLTIRHFYYHPISQLHIPSIRIRITDNHTDFILPFQKEVTCLLHFRRCNHYNNNNNHLI
jgi:hypothetical protein